MQQGGFAALSVPNHHDLTATDLPLPLPLPLPLHQRTGESVPVGAARAQPQYRTPCAADGQTARRCEQNRGKKKKYTESAYGAQKRSVPSERQRDTELRLLKPLTVDQPLGSHGDATLPPTSSAFSKARGSRLSPALHSHAFRIPGIQSNSRACLALFSFITFARFRDGRVLIDAFLYRLI